MECNRMGCQVCLTKFNRISDFGAHVRSSAHKEKMKEIFQKNVFIGPGHLPFISVIRPSAKHYTKQPIIGLSQVTVCFSLETKTFFYLCHICEEKCPPDKILQHLCSSDHCSNYFNYTNPNVLSFSWLPSMNMSVILRPELQKEVNERGSGELQMLDLPENLLKKFTTATYSEVMHTLRENDKLLKLLEAVKPKRMTIQTYQRDSNRKHPLLGMQHLVECICVEATEKRYYLCTLCKLIFATHTIIKHVLSFDHIFSYFRVWHPSTLPSKLCYNDYTKDFASMILDFAKQTREIHGTANTNMKQVSLERSHFISVNFTSYAEALKELESITKENKESSLITSVKPGNKLEHCNVSAKSLALFYTLRCQNCNMTFKTGFQYFKHVKNLSHKQMLKKLLGKAERTHDYDDQTGWTLGLGLYRYLIQSLRQKQPVIGIPLVVTCVSTQVQVDPIYLCFACEDCFPESLLEEHFNSRKHLIRTLLYQNPWRLPFAWENHLDVKVLRSVAWKEEEERGPNQMMLKVLDIPYWMFQSLIPPTYPKVMKKLELHHTLLKCEVPRCETYSKRSTKQNERFPLLGKQFLVMHVCDRQGQSTEVGFLCLLCERKLSDDEWHAHVFSREHVRTFLDCFHPDSLIPNADAETILDLAKQAACIHSISHEQIITLDSPITEPWSYHTLISKLASAKKSDRKGELKPTIMPKNKIFSRETFKDVDKDHTRDNSQKTSRMVEGSERKTSPMSTDNGETTLNKISVEVGAAITSEHFVESGGNAEKGTNKETSTPRIRDESEKKREVFSRTSSEEIKNAGNDTCQALKEEKIGEPIVRKPSGETLESCQNTKKDRATEIDEERIKNGNDVLTHLNKMYKENKAKGLSSMSEKSQNTYEDIKKDIGHKMQQQSYRQKEATTTERGESSKPSHETAKDKTSSNVNHQQIDQLWQYLKRKSREPVIGLGALLECHCDLRDPIYLCECCSLKIPEKDVISHVTGFDHQTIYLGLQNLKWSKQMSDYVRHRAVLLEKKKGYGEAQVFDLDEESYNNISKQDFESGIQTVKALRAQHDSGSELPSTSALSDVKPVETSVNLHAQHEVHSVTDDLQVFEMEIDDSSENSEVKPPSVTAAVSVMTETTSKTSAVCPESNEDVTVTHIRESADNTNRCQTVSRSSEDTSSLHVPTSRTNTTSLHRDSTGKAAVISNTTVGPVKIPPHTTSTTTISKCTAKPSNSTPDTIKLRETIYRCVEGISSVTAITTKPTAAPPNSSTTTICTSPIYSCPSATTNSRESAYKCVATISKCRATTSKLTGSTSSSSASISCTTSTTKSATVSKLLEGGTAAAPMQVAVTSFKAATGSTVVHEANSRKVPAAKIESTSINSETASKTMATSQTVLSSEATAKVTKASVKCENTQVSAKTVHVKNSVPSNAAVAPNIPKSNAPTEPSNTSASKTKPRESPPIGLSQLIKVSCERRHQVYCQLCSVRLKRSIHSSSFIHQFNYVKMNVPGWTAKQSELGSTLEEMVAHFAKAEREIGSRAIQRINVNIDVYKELGALPEDKAIERLKAMLRQRNVKVPSFSTTNAAEDLSQQVAFASPCEISSPDDGTYTPHSEMTGLSTDNQSEQENKHELQTLLVQMPEEERNLAKSDRALIVKAKGREANDMISDHLHLCRTLTNDPKHVAAHSIQDGDTAVNIKQETLESGVESQATVEDSSAFESPALLPIVKMETPQSCAHSESAGRFAQTLSCRETPEKGHQQERSDPQLQDTQEVLEGTQKTSPVESFNTDPLACAASVKIQQQNQSRPSLKAEYIPTPSCSLGSKHHNASQALPRISIGERTQGPSHLSAYLKVKGLETEPILGLSSVWECRGMSLKTFFLCESCRQTLSINEICQHMVSNQHLFKYMLKQYPQFLSFLTEEDLLPEMKLQLLKDIAYLLSGRELYNKIDAQCILLEKELYECIRTAPFSEALKMVQNIEKEQKLSVFCSPVCTPQQMDQLPENRHSGEESLPTEMQSAQALETVQRIDNETRQKAKKRPLEETTTVGDLHVVKQRRVSSPLNATSVSSKAHSVVSPSPGADACLSPRESCRSFSMHPKLNPPVSQHQRPNPELQVKRAELHLESPSSSIVSPSQTLSVSPRDECLPTRKRPAAAYVETPVKPGSNNPQLEDPLPAKCTHTFTCQLSPESASESPPVKPAAASTLLYPEDKDMRRTSNEQGIASESPLVNPAATSTLLYPEDKDMRRTSNEQGIASESPLVNPAATSTLLYPEDKDMRCRSDEQDAASESPPVNPAATSTLLSSEDKDMRCRSDEQDAASESPPVNPAATSTLLSSEDKDAGPGSDGQDTLIDWKMFPHLIALVRERKSEMNVFPAETITSCANTIESDVKRKCDSKCVQTRSTVTKKRRWDSKCLLVKATVGEKTSASSLEGVFSTAAPVAFGNDNQFVTPKTDSASLANPSSHKGCLMGAPEANATPSAGTADPSDPQHQRCVNVQRVFGNGSHFQPSPFYCVASNHNPGQIPQPRGNPETGVCHFPINTFITAQAIPTNQQFIGNYNGQDHTEGNRSNQIAPSFSTVVTASPSDTLAASGGCGQYSQRACVSNGHPGYFSSAAGAGYIAPDNPPVCTGSFCQHEGYTTRVLYPSHIYPEPEGNCFGYSLATPSHPGWLRLEMHYDTTPANSSQKLIDLNNYSTNRIVPTQNNVIISQNTPQVYLNPPVIHYSPAANSEATSQVAANTFFVSGREVFTVTPSVVNATPPFYPETTRPTM